MKCPHCGFVFDADADEETQKRQIMQKPDSVEPLEGVPAGND